MYIATTTPEIAQKRAASVAPIFAALKAERRMRGWLADKLGISLTVLKRYEFGLTQMPSEKMLRAFQLLGIEQEV